MNALPLALLAAAAVLLAGPALAVAGTDVAVATPDISFSTATPVDGSTVSILVTVHNLGDTDASNVVVTATLTSTGELLGASTISDIVAQSQAETAIAWNVTGEGNMTVTIQVRSDEVDVQPSNNNAISANIFVRSRPDLRVDQVTFDNPVPPYGTVAVGIFADISNIGGSDATLVKVAFYDGPPSSSNQIYNTTLPSGVTRATPVRVAYYWSLANNYGRHDIYARVESSIPAEKPSALDNDMANGRVLVLGPGDLEVTGVQRFETNPLFNGFVIIHSGGDLTLANGTFTLLQERNDQFDIIVEGGGKLTLWNENLASSYPFGLTIFAGGLVHMAGNSNFHGAIASTGGSLWLYNTTVGGSLTGTFGTLWVEDATVNGLVSLKSSAATFKRTLVSSPTDMDLDASTLSVEWLTLITGSDPALSLTGGSVAVLAGIDSGSIAVESGSSASVWREVNFKVADLTGIPIGGATVQSKFSLNSTLVSTVTTDARGEASVWLLTDLLSAGSPHYVGSYLHLATYLTYHTSTVSNLAYYPTLSSDANRQTVDLTFDVIDPSDLFAPTIGDRTVTGEWTIFDFNQTGNLDVRGVLNVDGTLTVWQTRDFETAIVINSGQVVVGAGGGIRSNHELNIYLYNGSELQMTGAGLEVNAVVTFGSSTVSIGGGSTATHTSFVLMGSSFTLGSGTTAGGGQLYARGGTSVIFDGATASYGVVDVQTSGDIQVNGTVLESGSNVWLRSSGPSSVLATEDSTIMCGAQGAAAFEAHFINLTTTNVLSCAISLFSASTAQARETSFAATLRGFKPGSSAAFYDVSYPSLEVDPSAIVTISHKLTITAMDLKQNVITDGTFQIRNVPSLADAGSGGLSASVEYWLQASQIALGFENFTGNYRVTVSPAAPGATPITRDVVMDGPVDAVFFFPQDIVQPNSVHVDAAVAPSSVLPGGQVSVTGAVSLFYPNRATSLLPDAGQSVELVLVGAVYATATTMADGTFNWTGAFSPNDTTPGTKQVTVRVTVGGIQGSKTLNIEMLRPQPSGLQLTLREPVLTAGGIDRAIGAGFTIAGQVFYTRPDGSSEPAANVVVQALFTSPPQPDAPPAAHTDDDGNFNINVGGRSSAKLYVMAVSARDDALGLVSNQASLNMRVGQAPPSTTGGLGSGLTLYILLAVVAAAAVALILVVVNAKRKSVNYVECGNCGRPAHEGDKKCPSCGVEFEEDIAKCSHCASWIPANAVRCPKCNTEFKPVDEAIEAPKAAPDAPAPEGVAAEVTTPTAPQPVRQPVAVKKKVLKTAEPASQASQQTQVFTNPWEQKPGDQAAAGGQQPPAQQPPADQPKPAEKKPDEKKEKGLFDDL